MSSTALKYNPGFMRDEELLRTFVVRIRDFEWALEVIRANTHLEANQHVLIVGARGSGKTTLVGRLAYEVRTDPEISRAWHPIMFSEESYAVNSPGEFWLEALFQIYNDTGDSRWKQVRDDLAKRTDDANLRELALGEVLEFADKLGKKLILIVENLNMLLGQLQANSDWDLRHTLLNESRIMLLGTATSKFSELENIDRAWFDLFTTHELKPLNTKESLTLWKSYTGNQAPMRQIQALRILTGGNPRLFRILSSFAVRSSFRELMENLTQLVDEHTEYFKGSLDALSPLERKVFVALLERWDPGDARGIAEAARMDVSKASSLLLRLVDKGRVAIVPSLGRKRRYQVAERLFNIYYLMRRRGRPADRVRAVVRFMVQFYQDDNLVDTVTGIAREACLLGPHERDDHYSAYAEVLRCGLDRRVCSSILRRTAPEFFQDEQAPPTVRRFAEISNLAIVAAMPEAVALLKKALHAKPSDLELGLLLGRVADPRTSELDDAPGRECEEPKAHKARVWLWIAEKLHDLGLFEGGSFAAEQAVAIDEKNAAAWQVRGELLYFHIKTNQEGDELAQTEKQAEAAFRKAIELEPGVAWCHRALASLLRGRGRLDDAELEAKNALQLDDHSDDNWAELGAIMLRRHNFAEAEKAFRKGLEISETSAFLWGELGVLLAHDGKRTDEAISAYKRALLINNKDIFSSRELMRLMLRVGTADKALSAIDDFLQRSEQDPRAVSQAAWAIIDAGPRELFPHAIDLLRATMARLPGAWHLAHPLASLLGKSGDWKSAVEAIQPAIHECISGGKGVRCVTDFMISASANGYASEALAILMDRGKVAALEPLEVGLRLYLGQHPIVAQEVLEVGADVAKRIRAELTTNPSAIETISSGAEESKGT